METFRNFQYVVKSRVESFFIHTLLIIVSITCVFPLVWMFISSLKTESTIFSDTSLFVKNPMWGNFYLAWTQGNFGRYFFNSFLYTGVIVFCIVLFASMAAYGFSRLKFPFRNFLFISFIASMMIPIPGAIIALFVLLKNLGLINTRLGYMLPQINAGLPLGIFMLKTFFDRMPQDLEDAARIDGCSKWGIYFHVALPLARPAIAVVVIFNTLSVWNEYILAMLVLSSEKLMPLQRGLMNFQGTHLVNYPLLMAGMTITVVPVIAVYLMMQKYIIKGISAGALKG